MKLRYLSLLLLLLLVFTACSGEAKPTPTPFSEGTPTEQALNPALPLAISISDLAVDPEAHADSFVEITGRYRRLPLLVCESEPYPAPATWQLQAEDGSVIAVGGFDSQLRSLLPDELTLTVTGVWQLFNGPVGCGKNAVGTEIWYLKVSNILSPSPLAQVTLTPTGPADQIAEGAGQTAVPTPPGDNGQAATATPFNSSGSPTQTPTLAGTTTPSAPGITPTNTAVLPTSPSGSSSTATPTATSSSGGTATPTSSSGSSTATATAGSSSTPSATVGPGTPSPTPVALTTATRNPNDFDTVVFDELSPEVPILEFLDPEQVHEYPIVFEYNGAITITAVAEQGIDLVLEIVDPSDDVVQQANNAGSGALESIVNAQLNVAIDYSIRLYDLNGEEGDYCLIFSEGGGFPDSIKGRITYGQTVQDSVEVLGIDYWCFLGSDGDNVSISSAATGSSGDFVVGLFGPPDFDAIGSVFQDAEILDADLVEDGMYIIGVLDFEAGASGYSMTLTEN